MDGESHRWMKWARSVLDVLGLPENRAVKDEAEARSLIAFLLVGKGKSWRCYHCDEVFVDEHRAGAHFGHDVLAHPACTESADKLRELEAELKRYREEDTDLDRKYHAMQADHAVALRREEEKGYERGLRDGMKEQAEMVKRLRETLCVLSARATAVRSATTSNLEWGDLTEAIIDADNLLREIT